MNDKEYYMGIAILLARKGIGWTSPNPAVGAVIVKGGKIIGKGYHKRIGLCHAEINALKEAGARTNGGEMYVTLEPCNHFGKTPPCTDAIIKAGIKKVFVGMKDPNPLVSGKGIKRLLNAGIKVEAGILEEGCRDINEPYIKYMKTRAPFVTLKLASTLDGKIASAAGDAKWITGETARKHAHRMRAQADAVMVGISTVLKDNPELTTRLAMGRDPLRVVVDSRLRIPVTAKVLNLERGGIIIATTEKASEGRINAMEVRGAEVMILPSRKGVVDLRALIKALGKREITSLLIEGGSSLAASVLKEGIVDKIAIFYAPKIFGREGLPMIGRLGIKILSEAVKLKDLKCRKIGEDILIEGYPEE